MDALITSSSNTLVGSIKSEMCSPSSCQDDSSTSTINLPSTSSYSNFQVKNPQLNIAANKLKTMMENKMKLENGELVSELLGSVIMDSCHGVRTSARVIQKMKENSARPSTPPLSERETKAKEEKSLQKTPSQTKPNKVVWSNLERNFFFDAINEFGKDFEAISNYINAKLKRKCSSDQCFKTKEQIRTLYYQTFHKLSKYIKFSDDVKKPVQELYALINYGEMRRKLQFVSEKNYMKIKDLVYKGYVIARSKGKNIRIKTPSCKTLRRLNQLEDWIEDIKLPLKVEVQLRPATMASFLQVQGVAQNPMVRIIVPLQKKLINILRTFQNKWRSKEAKLIIEAIKIQQDINSQNNNQKSSINISDLCSVSGNTNNTNPITKESLICLRPMADAVIHRPLLSITEVLSSFNVCLNSYEERIGVRVRGEILCNEKNHLKRQRTESNCEKRSPETKKVKQPDINVSVSENINHKPNFTQIKNIEIKADSTMNLQNLSNSIKEEFKLGSSGDELDENNLQGDFTEIQCDSNDDSDVKFSRQDSNSDIECHTTSTATTNIPQESSFITPVNNNLDKTVALTTSNPAIPTSNSNLIHNNDCNPVNNNNNNNTTHHNNSQSNNRVKKSKKKDQNNIQKKDMTNVRPLINEEIIRKIRKGWTISNVSDITVGDLYIVFGNDSKLIFEYFWTNEDFGDKTVNNSSNLIINHQSDETIFSTGLVAYTGASTNNDPEEHEQQLKIINKIHSSSLTDKLKQLLVIANLNERTKKKACSCGHTCDKFAKARLENELFNRSIISNKNNMMNDNETKGNPVFRQPLIPYRKSVFSIDAYKSKQSKIVRGGGILKSQHLFVQRVLPVQPGVSQRYDVLKINTNEENTKKQMISKHIERNDNNLKPNTTISNISKYSKISKPSSTITSSQANSIHNFSSMQYTNDNHTIISNKEENLSNINNNNNDDFNEENFKINNSIQNDSSLSTAVSSSSSSNNSMPDLSPIMELSLPSPLHTPKYLEENTNYTNSFMSIPSMSPGSLLRDVNSSDSSKWLEENINDYSLSSLLGHLDEINNGRDIMSIDRSNISSNLSVISETSVDYMTKFAEIAASMQNEEKDL